MDAESERESQEPLSAVPEATVAADPMVLGGVAAVIAALAALVYWLRPRQTPTS